MEVIEPLDGPPVLVVGTGSVPWNGSYRSCYIGSSFGDYGVGFDAAAYDPNGPLDEHEEYEVAGWASWGNPKSFTTKAWTVAQVGTPAAYFDSVTIDSRGFSFDGFAPETIFGFDFSTQTALIATGQPHVEYPTSAGDCAIVVNYDSPYSIARLARDGTLARLATPTSPQVVTWKSTDRSTTIPTLVWVESDFGLGYTNSTLWAAPLADSESSGGRSPSSMTSSSVAARARRQTRALSQPGRSQRRAPHAPVRRERMADPRRAGDAPSGSAVGR